MTSKSYTHIYKNYILMSAFISFFEHLIPAKRIDIFGKDSLMNSTIPYYILAALTVYGFFAMHTNAWSLLFIAYAVLPFLDDVFSHDTRNPNEEERKNLERNDWQFKMVLYVTIVIDWFFFFKAMDYFYAF